MRPVGERQPDARTATATARPTGNRRVQRMIPARRPLDHQQVIDLQRSAGNHATTSLVVQREPADTSGLATPIINALETASAGALKATLGMLGPAMAPMVVEALAAAGFKSESKVTNVAFWLHHPSRAGQKLGKDDPNFAALSKEWVRLRDTLVRPTLTPTAAPATEAAGATDAADVVPPGPQGDTFVKDWAKSTIDLLPPKQRKRFEGVEWGRLDFPGKRMPTKGMKPEAAAWWRQQPSVKEVEGPNGYFTGTNQALAGELFSALAAVRPGGGERRVNISGVAVVPEAAFARDPKEFYAYVTSLLEPIPGDKRNVRMNAEAAKQFAAMRDAAKADGVRFSANNGFRPLEREKAAEKAAGNRNAVGGISHLIGLAVDVNLDVSGTIHDFRSMVKLLHTPSYKWIFMHGAKYGFYQYKAEPWHWEYNPPGFRDRFYAKAPELKTKAEDALGSTKKP